MKFVLGALAAVTLLVGVAASQPAEARCVWNGYGWQCWHPHHYGHGYGYGYGYGYSHHHRPGWWWGY